LGELTFFPRCLNHFEEFHARALIEGGPEEGNISSTLKLKASGLDMGGKRIRLALITGDSHPYYQLGRERSSQKREQPERL
jgi:hypothetical protein